MSVDQHGIKAELNCGLRNRKHKRMVTFQFNAVIAAADAVSGSGAGAAHASEPPNDSSRVSLASSNRSIRNHFSYHFPRKGIKISYAYGIEEDDSNMDRGNKNNNGNSGAKDKSTKSSKDKKKDITHFIKDVFNSFSKEEQNFITGVAKSTAKSHAATAIMTAFNISPVTFFLGSLLINYGGIFNFGNKVNSGCAAAQELNDTWTLNNYTIKEGPWEYTYFDACSFGASEDYEFCNQYTVFDQSGNQLFFVNSYIGITDRAWGSVPAELNPPPYCQAIFEQCRSVSATLESVKALFNENDPSLFDGGACIDQRSVSEDLCPSTTVFGNVSPEGCYFLKGCNSTDDSSVFSKCIEQGLLNVTLDVNDTINYNPGLASTDCTIPPEPYYPPYYPPYNPFPPYNPPAPSSSTGVNDTSIESLTGTSADSSGDDSNWGWIAVPIAGACLLWYCWPRIKNNYNTCQAKRKSIKDEQDRIIKERRNTVEQFVVTQELLSLKGSSGEQLNEHMTGITLAFLYDHTKDFNKVLLTYAKKDLHFPKHKQSSEFVGVPCKTDDDQVIKYHEDDIVIEIAASKKSGVSV